MKTFNPSLCHLHENKGHWSYKEPIKELIMIKQILLFILVVAILMFISLYLGGELEPITTPAII